MSGKEYIRSTRVNKHTMDVLEEVGEDLDLKRAEVDRQILDLMAAAMKDRRKRGESISWFFWRVFEEKK